jgi:hypothetical protein
LADGIKEIEFSDRKSSKLSNIMEKDFVKLHIFRGSCTLSVQLGKVVDSSIMVIYK